MNAKIREIIYYLGTLLVGGVGLAVTLGALTAEQGANIGQILTGLLTLLGAGAPALAAKKTAEQRKDGTFDAPANPVLDAFESLNAVKARVDEVVDEAQAKVAQATTAIQGAAAMLPGGAAVTSAVLSGPVGDLIQAVTDREKVG
ncbi:hypothetical protein [Mycolicibacterium sp. F2034L]|uniref:hypothetical protein n=1 Tax=Mycolicibacterium sp. F2034L TaxID=2926422 RepID=UPI001FF5E27A|nr:hypothetical protein [Mycolicibacterium sp. F2034L]MCK0174816.1 hypothetical protein [Mycolicibacterium sp. F2034L]